MIKLTKYALGVLALCTLLNTTYAQTRFSDPKKTLEEEVWGKLYKDGGKTFFCDKTFSKKGILVTESHIYSTSWIRDHLRCGTPRQCRENDQYYRRVTSDLHNIFPADSRVELERRNAKFEELPSNITADNCGLKRAFQIIEPPDERKGDIARILFYMSETYDLPLIGDLNQLKRWNRIDPPSAEEIERDSKIQEIQGNGNAFVANPALIDAISN